MPAGPIAELDMEPPLASDVISRVTVHVLPAPAAPAVPQQPRLVEQELMLAGAELKEMTGTVEDSIKYINLMVLHIKDMVRDAYQQLKDRLPIFEQAFKLAVPSFQPSVYVKRAIIIPIIGVLDGFAWFMNVLINQLGSTVTSIDPFARWLSSWIETPGAWMSDRAYKSPSYTPMDI